MKQQARQQFLNHCEHWMLAMQQQPGGLDGDARSASVFRLFSRLLWLFFLQQHRLLCNDPRYLFRLLQRARDTGSSSIHVLARLLHALELPWTMRPAAMQAELGRVPFLGLFPDLPFPDQDGITLPDHLVEDILGWFAGFTWEMDEQGEEQREAVTPAVLGHLMERVLAVCSSQQRKQTGTYYTPEFIRTYMVEQTCDPFIVTHFQEVSGRSVTSLPHLLETMDAREAGMLLFLILPTLSVIDAAVGTAGFLVTALGQVVARYQQVLECVEQTSHLQHPGLLGFLEQAEAAPGGRATFLRARVLTRNLFGVDIQAEPLAIARLRLSLALLCQMPAGCADLAPAPPLLFSLLRGNALIGVETLPAVEQQLTPQYATLVEERYRLIARYRDLPDDPVARTAILTHLQSGRVAAYEILNDLLAKRLERTRHSREAVWTAQRVAALDPFHWTFDFDAVMNHPWWFRCDPQEAWIQQRHGGSIGVCFGPGTKL